jgi:hypothetical protein
MAKSRSTKAEVARRVAEIFPLVCDCFSMREIRTIIDARMSWGHSVSDSTLKYYAKRCRAQLRELARFDREAEIGASKARLERIIARSSAKGELATELAANRQLCDLLGLAAPTRSEIRHSGEISLQEKRSLLVEKILKEVKAQQGAGDDGQES